MKTIFAIGLGSCIGGVCRYLMSHLIDTNTRMVFPLGTLCVNILGCLLIGVVFGLATRGTITQEWRLYLATGLLGGFTTFSAFSIETIHMLRDGRFGYALIYIGSSIVFGLAATYGGLVCCK